MSVSTTISNARKQKGLTQEELADLSGLTVRTIQRIENGQTFPRAFTIKALAAALAIDPQSLLDLDRQDSPVDYPGQQHFLQLLCLSCFAYLVIPFVHFLLPYYILRKRGAIEPAAQEFGRKLIRQQVYWTIALHFLLILTVAYNFLVVIYAHPSYFLHYLIPLFAMHLLNAVIILRQLRQIKSPRFCQAAIA